MQYFLDLALDRLRGASPETILPAISISGDRHFLADEHDQALAALAAPPAAFAA